MNEYQMFGIGDVAIKRLILCAEKPMPHICKQGDYCPYTRLIRHGLVEHVCDGEYSATRKGREFIKNLKNYTD